MNANGRPPLYNNAEDLEVKIDEYFSQCEPEFAYIDGVVQTTNKGMPVIINLNAPSVSGLALFLGYASRQSIYDNEKKEQFSYIIKKAKSKVEEWIYQHTLDNTLAPAVGIFILKQFGYTDKQEIDHNINKKDLSNLSQEDLIALADLNRKARS